jgi:hypothetical protein
LAIHVFQQSPIVGSAPFPRDEDENNGVPDSASQFGLLVMAVCGLGGLQFDQDSDVVLTVTKHDGS